MSNENYKGREFQAIALQRRVQQREISRPSGTGIASYPLTSAEQLANNMGSLFEGERGRIWVTSYAGVVWFENGR